MELVVKNHCSSTLEIMVFVHPTRGHGGPYSDKGGRWLSMQRRADIVNTITLAGLSLLVV